MTKVPTGITGLDEVLYGGLRRQAVHMVEGAPGTGKTTLGLQFIYNGITKFDEPGMIVTFEELPHQLHQDAANFGWNLRELEQEGKLKVIGTMPTILREQFLSPQSLFDQWARKLGVKRLFVDSVNHFQRVSDDQHELRELFVNFMNEIKRHGFTTVFCMEGQAREEATEIPFEEYTVDSVILVTNDRLRTRQRRRYIEVLKARGQDYITGRHAFRFGSTGMVVFPSTAVRRHLPKSLEKEPRVLAKLSSGIEGLDDMLGGGLLESHTALVAGSSGTGKTTLALQFLFAGCRAGEPGLLVSLSEGDLVGTIEALGMPYREELEAGTLRVIHEHSCDMSADELLHETRKQLAEQGARRLVFDSISDLRGFVNDDGELRDWVFALVHVCKELGVTAVITANTAEPFGEFRLDLADLPLAVDSLIFLRFVEIDSGIANAISVLKSRGADHSRDICEYQVTSRGIVIGPKFAGREGMMRGSATLERGMIQAERSHGVRPRRAEETVAEPVASSLSVVRANERIVYSDSLPGITMDLAAPDLNRRMEPLIVAAEPGARLSDEAISHAGEEWGHVLEGSLLLHVGGETHELSPGDSFYFPSSLPHRWEARGEQTTRIVWVVSPPSF